MTNRAIDKIKKLLRLAKSANEHEIVADYKGKSMFDNLRLKHYREKALAKSSVGIETPYTNRRDNASLTLVFYCVIPHT